MADFVLQITDWYRQNARDLPWRRTKNAYFIWLSEVILQQTRVDQGMNYYLRFVDEFPTVTHLAQADEESVLKLWQGLGYYSRARNLHKTAQEVVERFGGEFPASYTELLSLKGIGPYTAAAIASFAFDLPHAVVDGNVYRVLSRYFGIDTPIDSTGGKKEFQSLADTLIPAFMPALFNQAVMEFGALYCTPANPDCTGCILNSSCPSAGGLYRTRPLKSKKTAVRDRYFHYFHIEGNGSLLVRKRDFKDVWHNLYEFPMIETAGTELSKQELADFGLERAQLTEQLSAKHVLSHQRIHATFYRVAASQSDAFTHFITVDSEGLHKLPVHRLMSRYMETFGL